MYDGVNTSEMFKKETSRLGLGKARTLNLLELYGLAMPGKLREQLKVWSLIKKSRLDGLVPEAIVVVVKIKGFVFLVILQL